MLGKITQGCEQTLDGSHALGVGERSWGSPQPEAEL